MTLLDLPIGRLDGSAATLGDLTGGRPALVVNVASRCGLTPQYAALEALHEEYAGRGFTVVGVPCNQFGGQEPGDEAEIARFCCLTYDVSFPLLAKVEVNGAGAHPVFAHLKHEKPGLFGTGEIKWNFTKFLVGRDGRVIGRYPPQTKPADIENAVVAALVEAPP